ncbi:MAG TPA: glycine cleavage system aminomethyltransferase GcvT [Verrucomicrobiae bacterium]|nr:glycine cleavage system aminomethyltransferase GcvT [Verrucomicrobiae bacterium]
MTTLKRTPLYDCHAKAGAKLIDFGGWEMPVQYAGIIDEHRAVRTKAGLFDVSHMGEIDVRGPQALDMVNMLVTNDVSKLADGQILYTPMCYEHGGIVDDLLVYRHNQEHFLLVVNASNTDKDFAWVEQLAAKYNVKVVNISAQTAQLALQGPLAESILQKIADIDLAGIKYYWFTYGKIAGVDCLISRTGYTGEDGFEFYFAPEFGPKLWDEVLTAGQTEGAQPIGLGARDTLRFEACLPLYGNELGQDISPLEAGIGFFVKLDKPQFTGKEALAAQKAAGVPRKIVGFEMIDRGIPRSHYPLAVSGTEVGFVTSGSFSPTLEKNIGLGLIKAEEAEMGKEIEVIVRGKGLKARIIPKPFYKRQK